MGEKLKVERLRAAVKFTRNHGDTEGGREKKRLFCVYRIDGRILRCLQRR